MLGAYSLWYGFLVVSGHPDIIAKKSELRVGCRSSWWR
jgi:hypothetical protein